MIQHQRDKFYPWCYVLYLLEFMLSRNTRNEDLIKWFFFIPFLHFIPMKQRSIIWIKTIFTTNDENYIFSIKKVVTVPPISSTSTHCVLGLGEAVELYYWGRAIFYSGKVYNWLEMTTIISLLLDQSYKIANSLLVLSSKMAISYDWTYCCEECYKVCDTVGTYLKGLQRWLLRRSEV